VWDRESLLAETIVLTFAIPPAICSVKLLFFIVLFAALRGEGCRSFSLPENLILSSPQPQQPSSSASSSLIASIEEKCLRTPVDTDSAPQCAIDHATASTDVKSPVCDVIVTSHDSPCPSRNIRPTRLEMTAVVQSSRVDSSPDDGKPLVGILLNRSPRRRISLLGFVVCRFSAVYFAKPYYTSASFHLSRSLFGLSCVAF